MNASPTVPTPSAQARHLLSALARATAERLVAYRSLHTPGLWECKQYHIVETGPRPQDVACDCADATFRERVCKHAVCVVFARKHGIRPVRSIPVANPKPAPRCAGYLRLHADGTSHWCPACDPER